jgi:hypothetical protein
MPCRELKIFAAATTDASLRGLNWQEPDRRAAALFLHKLQHAPADAGCCGARLVTTPQEADLVFAAVDDNRLYHAASTEALGACSYIAKEARAAGLPFTAWSKRYRRCQEGANGLVAMVDRGRREFGTLMNDATMRRKTVFWWTNDHGSCWPLPSADAIVISHFERRGNGCAPGVRRLLVPPSTRSPLGGGEQLAGEGGSQPCTSYRTVAEEAASERGMAPSRKAATLKDRAGRPASAASTSALPTAKEARTGTRASPIYTPGLLKHDHRT